MDPTKLEAMSASELLAWAVSTFRDRFAISTSFQSEGMVLVDMAVRINPKIRVFTLDTGRLPEETYQIMDSLRERYGVAVEVVFPDAGEVERMASRHGVNLFRNEVALRKLCCHVRKVRPLEKKLLELEAWATGLRREQSGERAAIPKVDLVGGRVKLNPLADWTRAAVEEYQTRNGVPRHPLESRGYPSIGCAPCTRAIGPEEEERAGRWWWEKDASKECGLHATPAGTLRRSLDVLLEEIVIQ